MRCWCFFTLLLLLPYTAGCGTPTAARPNVQVEDDDEPDPSVLDLDPGAPREKIESPLYNSWSGFKVGTTITQKEVTEAGNNKTETTIRYTLLELTDDQVILESVTATRHSNGDQTQTPPEKFTNPRRIVLPPGRTKLEFGKRDGLLEEGEETVTAAGKEYKAKWHHAKGKG